MKKLPVNYVLTIVFLVVAAGGALFFHSTGEAQRNRAAQWEYAVITGTYISQIPENQAVFVGISNICYLESAGCRSEESRADLVYTKFLQDFRLENTENSKNLAYNRVKDNAFSKAISRLGADGWEMISKPAYEFENYLPNNQNGFNVVSGNKPLQTAVYFKRLKQ